MKSADFGAIIGALGGVVLGYILNSISKFGKLKPLFQSVTREYIARDSAGQSFISETLGELIIEVRYNINVNF